MQSKPATLRSLTNEKDVVNWPDWEILSVAGSCWWFVAAAAAAAGAAGLVCHSAASLR